MNAKTAKKLRKITLGMAVAAEQKNGKAVDKVGYQQNQAGTIIVAKNTYKGAYKAMKKGLRNGSIGV